MDNNLQNPNTNPVPQPSAPVEPPVPPAQAAAPAEPAAPVTPPPQTNFAPPTFVPVTPAAEPVNTHKEIRYVLPAMLVVLLLAGAYAFYAKTRNADSQIPVAPVTGAPVSAQTEEPEPVIKQMVSDVKVADYVDAGLTMTIPEGYPSWVPVEAGGIIENNKIFYESKDVVQYSITYTSTKTGQEVWRLLNDTGSKAGFTLTKDASQANGVYVAANSEGDTFMAVVTSQNGETLVQTTFLDR